MYFNLFDDSLSRISTEIHTETLLTIFSFENKTVGSYVIDDELLSIHFCHSFDFSENNGVSIFESMSFVFVGSNGGFGLIFGNINNNSIFDIFTIGIENNVLFSIIYKTIPVKTEISSIHESDIFGSTEFVGSNKLIFIIKISKYNNVILF